MLVPQLSSNPSAHVMVAKGVACCPWWHVADVAFASCHLHMQALDWGVEIALGVAQLHDRNLLHGDLKELNVLLSNPSTDHPNGRCMVADLPAKFLAPGELAVLGTHILTADCAAPEQVQMGNQMLFPGSDCFGLALMLMRMLSWAGSGSDLSALACALPRCPYTYGINIDELRVYAWFMGLRDGDLLYQHLWGTVLRRALDSTPLDRPHIAEIVAALLTTMQAIQRRRVTVAHLEHCQMLSQIQMQMQMQIQIQIQIQIQAALGLTASGECGPHVADCVATAQLNGGDILALGGMTAYPGCSVWCADAYIQPADELSHLQCTYYIQPVDEHIGCGANANIQPVDEHSHLQFTCTHPQ
jgi:hypothetical protein